MDWFAEENVQASRGKALVELALLPEMTLGGIIRIPDSRMQREDNKIARVLSVHKEFSDETGVKPGDMVLLGRYTGHTWVGKRKLFVEDSVILGIYEGDEYVS